MTEAATKKCELCKADITADQIINRQAGLVKGILLCPGCVEQKRKEALEAHKAAVATPAGAVAGSSTPPALRPDIGDELISMDPEPEVAANAPSKIRSFAAGSTLAGAHHDAQLHRPVTGVSEPPTRCRTFHSKLTPGALAHMDDQINEWMDAHPEIYVKHVVSAVGPFEAKHVEQHLILTLFY